MAKGIISIYGNNNTENILFFDFVAEQWIDSLKHKSELRQTSIERYKQILNKYIYPYFKGVEICKITRRDVEYICSELLETGGEKNKGLSPKTVSDVLSVIKNVLNYASINNDINIPNLTDIKIKQTHKEMKVLTISEQLRIDRYLRTNRTPGNIGIFICLHTGIRLGEICALKWEDIDISKRCISVRKTAQRVQQGDNQKSKLIAMETGSGSSKRDIPISDDMLKILQQNRGSSNAYVLTGTTDMLDPRALRNRFKKILETLEIPDTNFNTLRDTFAVRCVETGMNIKSLSEMLGHSSVTMTMDKYVHPSMEEKVMAVNMLSDMLGTRILANVK